VGESTDVVQRSRFDTAMRQVAPGVDHDRHVHVIVVVKRDLVVE